MRFCNDFIYRIVRPKTSPDIFSSLMTLTDRYGKKYRLASACCKSSFNNCDFGRALPSDRVGPQTDLAFEATPKARDNKSVST